LFAWSGQVMEPVDGLAFIGRSPGDEHVFLATGDSGHGMTHGTIAGMIISELVEGRPHPWARVYDPSRKTLRSVVEYAKENASVVKHLSEHVRPAEQKSIDGIAPGEGAIVSRQGAKLAVYRDEQGGVHEMSAVCTHLGCLVHFNREEKSWDCPCHGSRFSTTGEVLSGPARAPLGPADDADAQTRRRARAGGAG
jgi:Rieske Fe-S protein